MPIATTTPSGGTSATVFDVSHSLKPLAKWPSRLYTLLPETLKPSGLWQSEAKPPSSELAMHQLSAKTLSSPVLSHVPDGPQQSLT